MSERISPSFRARPGRDAQNLIPFITAGDPHPDWTVDIMHALVDGGANLIELGVPFSDPMADGPVIQEASERAIAKGVTLRRCWPWSRGFVSAIADTPVVLMGYMNPMERFGAGRTRRAACADAGVDGLLLVDCPPEEARNCLRPCSAARHRCRFAWWRPPPVNSGCESICAAASGFIYYVSFKGITGANRLDAEALAGPISAIRAHSSCPWRPALASMMRQSARRWRSLPMAWSSAARWSKQLAACRRPVSGGLRGRRGVCCVGAAGVGQ